MAMKRTIHFLLITINICVWLHMSHAQIIPTKIEHLDSLMLENPKPILFLLSTDWCQYCAIQKQQIQKNKNFDNKSEKFYFVEFDAERKDEIILQGKVYKFRPKGINLGTHELAIALNGNSKLSYPSWVLVDEQFNSLFRQNGLLKPKELNQLLDAIHTNTIFSK